MEYIYYILIILCIVACSLLLLRLPGQSRLRGDQMALSQKARYRKNRQQKSNKTDEYQQARKHLVLKRELSKVPAPWGWPGHDPAAAYNRQANLNARQVHGVSETLHNWVDSLIREKQPVDEAEYLLKKKNSMRALLEDRYGRASQMKALRYQKVKAPMLRDPNLPHDQMDNFPGGKGEKIESKLRGQAEPSKLHWEKIRKTELKTMKKPWGW
jgi:hypothetical protein